MEPNINPTSVPIVTPEPINNTINMTPQSVPTPEQSKSKLGKTIILIICIAVVGAGLVAYKKYMTNNTPEESTVMTTEQKITTPMNRVNGYLEKTDPIYTTINARVVSDLKTSLDKVSAKGLYSKAEKWSDTQKDELNAVYEKSFSDYLKNTGLDKLHITEFQTFSADDFRSARSEIGSMSDEKIAQEYDIRVQYFDGNYVAEFWQDNLKAFVGTPNETYFKERIASGKMEQFVKAFALLYTVSADNTVVFVDPIQSVYDLLNKN